MALYKDSVIKISNLNLQLESNQINDIINIQINNIFEKRDPIAISFLNEQELWILPKPHANFFIEDNRLKGTIPIHILTNLNIPVKKIKAEGDILLHLDISISRKDQHHISICTNIKDIEWMSDLDIQPPLLNYLVPNNFIQDLIKKQIPTINEKMNEAIAEILDISALLAKIEWNRMIDIPLKNGQNLVLSVRPHLIQLFKIGLENDILSFSVNVDIMIHPALINEDPDRISRPEVVFLTELSQSKDLKVEVFLDLESLDQSVLKVIKSMPNIENAIGCNIENLMVRSVNGDGIAIALKLKGLLNGALSIGGRPVVDQNSLNLNIENLAFDFSSKSILSSLKGNIALSVAKSVIRKQFPIALKQYLDNLFEAVNALISEVKIFEGVVLKGNINGWNLDKLAIENGQIVVTIRTRLSTFLSASTN